MLAPEVHPAPKSTKHPGRAQVVSGGTARETQILFFTEAEARQWATTGTTTAPTPTGPVPAPSPRPPADPRTQVWPAPELPPTSEPPASRDQVADAWNLTPAAIPGPGTASPAVPASPAPADNEDQVVGLREAHEHHLPDITVAALRYARGNDPTFPGPADKRGAELLYRVGDLKRWARNRPRAASGTTDLD